jgi:hypothetical protein
MTFLVSGALTDVSMGRPRSVPPPATALLQAHAEHLARRRGNPETTIEKKLNHVEKLQEHLAKDDNTWRSMKLVDIDGFLIACAGRFARPTVSDIACTVRCFSRFLFASGHISIDLADAVVAGTTQISASAARLALGGCPTPVAGNRHLHRRWPARLRAFADDERPWLRRW